MIYLSILIVLIAKFKIKITANINKKFKKDKKLFTNCNYINNKSFSNKNVGKISIKIGNEEFKMK